MSTKSFLHGASLIQAVRSNNFVRPLAVDRLFSLELLSVVHHYKSFRPSLSRAHAFATAAAAVKKTQKTQTHRQKKTRAEDAFP